MKAVTGVFSSLGDAELAIRDLERRGISSGSLNLIAGNGKNFHDECLIKSKEASKDTGSAAASAASFGGGFGILASVVALAIPGVGPILAGGAIVNVLTGLGIGAITGGLIGIFRNMGISHEEAPLYEEAARRGEVIALAEVDESMEAAALDVMKWHGARDIRDEADTWRAAGWSGPAEDPHPFVADDAIAPTGTEDRVDY